MIRRLPLWSCLLIVLGIAISQVMIAQKQVSAKDQGWYVSAGAVRRVTLKPTTKYWRFQHLSLNPDVARQQILKWKSEGITALEIFAPEDGGDSYDGLDAKNRYRLDPGLGSMADFRRLVALAHSLGVRVTVFENLGYSAVDGVQFEKAEDAVRKGEVNRYTKMFFWSQSANAPKPAASNSNFFCRPKLPGYNPTKSEFWQWSPRAKAYYWTRWPGKDASGNTLHLPQYNWSGSVWPEESSKVVHFWMNTGIDGMVLDAVNWYVGADWQKIDHSITDVIASYGNEFSQPEGGGGFGEDPGGWVTEGNFTNIYDYGLGIWWKKTDRPLVTSVEQSDPAILEKALRSYHDRVVAAGGTLYFPVPQLDAPGDQRFAEALIATSGDLPCYCDPVGKVTVPAEGISQLLKLKPENPALYQNSLRRRIPTNDDAHIYAIERYAADNSERLLLVFNFSDVPVHATIDLGAIHGNEFIDLFTRQRTQTVGEKLTTSLKGHGYVIFKIEGYGRRKVTMESGIRND